MTQLFDTETYAAPADHDPADTSGRHLRILPTDESPAPRPSEWRLDADTIAVGRRGIQAARLALQEAARSDTSPKPTRTAA